jgi:hypothetical protein
LEELLLVGCRVVLFPQGMEQLESLKKIDLASNKMPVLSRFKIVCFISRFCFTYIIFLKKN